ncbi:hypothetical protein HPB48_016434 [Haemaphysalis longicornis]|uniref:Uncharacterized protein n=1 Tax=Haemaphysalis longicornis TaxID=44386 RepID=A0A9J6FEG2_HAELO|nr:hypothetical protein HPB48_016434 [Haemaphysalis longicornis]
MREYWSPTWRMPRPPGHGYALGVAKKQPKLITIAAQCASCATSRMKQPVKSARSDYGQLPSSTCQAGQASERWNGILGDGLWLGQH